MSVNAVVSANSLLGDEERLREQMQRDGYLYFQGLFDPEPIRTIRAQAAAICREAGLLDDEGRVLRAPGRDTPDVLPRLFGLEAVHAFFHAPLILDVARQIVGEPVVPHVHKQVRLQFPAQAGTAPQVTGAHQDFVYNQGSTEVFTCWVPAGDVPRDMGGLEVLKGSHRRGVRQVEAPPDGSITLAIPESELAGEWVSPDYRLGDAIFFHSLTIHRAPPNHSGSLRISLDCRYQGLSQPFSRMLLEPLSGVEAAYPAWKSQELVHYWKRLPLKTVEHDMTYLEKLAAWRSEPKP